MEEAKDVGKKEQYFDSFVELGWSDGGLQQYRGLKQVEFEIIAVYLGKSGYQMVVYGLEIGRYKVEI